MKIQVIFKSGSSTNLIDSLDEAIAELVSGHALKVSFDHAGGRFIIRASSPHHERLGFQRSIGIWEYWAAPNDNAAQAAPTQPPVPHGRHSTSPCTKCGAKEVYVSQDSDDDADFDIHCYGCGRHYRVDGPDS